MQFLFLLSIQFRCLQQPQGSACCVAAQTGVTNLPSPEGSLNCLSASPGGPTAVWPREIFQQAVKPAAVLEPH